MGWGDVWQMVSAARESPEPEQKTLPIMLLQRFRVQGLLLLPVAAADLHPSTDSVSPILVVLSRGRNHSQASSINSDMLHEVVLEETIMFNPGPHNQQEND